MPRSALRLSNAFAILLFASAALSQARDFRSLRVTPEEFHWIARGTNIQRADLVGQENRRGPYVYRLRFARGYKASPHTHPDDRVVTVISGTFYVGFTERFDESEVKRMPPGSTWTEPVRQAHYGWAKDGDVEIQVVGYGPSGTNRTL